MCTTPQSAAETFLDMTLNASKSVCIRYGPRFNSDCSEISTNDGDCLRWVRGEYPLEINTPGETPPTVTPGDEPPG